MWGAVAVLLTAVTVLGGGAFDLADGGFHAAIYYAEVGAPPQPSIIIDLLQIQWWQGIAAFMVALGLSPAPWILGLAVGRIQFTKVAEALHAREIAEIRRNYDALLAVEAARYSELAETNRANAEAAEKHRGRADEVTDAALAMTEVVAANTHVIASLNEVAREATGHG